MPPETLYGILQPRFQELLNDQYDHILIGGQKIEDRYGVTLETLIAYGIGWIPPGFELTQELAKHMEPSHILTTQGHGLLTFAKQLYESRPFFEGRIVFPYFEDGKVIYWSGRETDQTPANHPMKAGKYLHMRLDGKPRPLYLNPEPETYLVEGMFHALILRQLGFAGVCTGSKFPSQDQIARLRSTHRIFWIPDVDVLAPEKPGMRERSDGARHFYQGKTHADKLAALLPTLRELPQTRLVQYPDEFLSQEKGDLNDYFKTYSVDNFIDLLQDAADPDDVEVKSIPTNLSAQERAQRLDEFAKAIQIRTPIESNALINSLAKHLKLGKEEVSYLRTLIKTARSTGTPKEDGESIATQHRKIYPGMDYTDGVLYYTVARRTLTQKRIDGQITEIVEETPWMVTSTRELFPATEIELAKRRLYFARGTDPKDAKLIWNDSPSAKWSIADFIENKACPDTDTLYNNIRDYFKTYLFVKDEEVYDVLALYTILSYCVQVFNTAPILGFNGIKGSGKSRGLDLLDCIGYNSQMTSSASPSSIFRFIESSNGMLLLDEQEKLASAMKTRTEFDETSLILNTCYKKGGGAMRTVGETLENHNFRTYTTVAVANQNGFHPTLASRMIILRIVRARKELKIPEWTRDIGEQIGGELRQQLFCWTLSNVGSIKHAYHRFASELSGLLELAGLYNRERECWIALFSLALAVDTLAGRPFHPNRENPFPQKGHHVLANILDASSVLTAHKQEMMNADETFSIMLAALREIVNAQTEDYNAPVKAYTIDHRDVPEINNSDWYSTKELTADLNKREGLEFFPAVSGQRALGIVLKKAEVIGEHDLKTKASIGGKRTTAIRLTKEAIDKACERFDVPKDMAPDYVDKKGKDSAES